MDKRKFFHLSLGGVIGLSGLGYFQAQGRAARVFTPLSTQEENDVRRLASNLNPLFELHPGS
jgi:nucleoid DNA-binding protein